jgi:hypothetical protein
MIQVVVFFLAMLLVSATVTGQNLTKEDFAKLQGKDRTFYFVGLELAYSKLDYKSTYKEDLGPIVSQLDGEFVEAIPVEKLKSSIEEKLDLKVNTMAFNMKFENRKDNGFFNKDVEASERFIYHKWTVPSRKNQLILSVFLYKTGTMIKVNQAKIEIRFLVLNKEGTAYDTLLYTSQDKSWKDYRELYSILKESCVIE